MTRKPTVKRIYRDSAIPDDYSKLWPFGQKDLEFLRMVDAKIARKKRENDERQREYAREQAIEKRRGLAPKPQAQRGGQASAGGEAPAESGPDSEPAGSYGSR